MQWPLITLFLAAEGISPINRRQLLTGLFSNKPLAVKGDRLDPTNKLRHYRGGYDLTSKHYWASVAYTGIYGYSIGVAWLLLGLIIALLACSRCCCCPRERSKEHHSSNYYWLPRILVLLLSLFAIGCFIALFVRNKQVFNEANKAKHTISDAATIATDAVHTVTNTLAKVDNVMTKYNIPGLSAFASVEASLNKSADSITNKINRNVRKFNRLVTDVEIVLIVILSLGLLLILAGLIPAFLRWRRFFFVIIVIGWILAALTWLLFGLFFFLNNVADDTCEALDEYIQAPANTTLNSLVPCVDLAAAGTAFTLAREVIYNGIETVNSTVTSIQQFNNFIGTGNGSVSGICNPIGGPPNYTYIGTCANGTITIGNLPVVLQPYVCLSNMSTLTCFTDGRWISQSENTTLYELSNGAQSLLNIIPTISGLANCSFVYNTFETFVNERCNPLKSGLRHLWIPLLLVSIGLTLLTAAWVLTNHRNTHQWYMGTIYAQDFGPTRVK